MVESGASMLNSTQIQTNEQTVANMKDVVTKTYYSYYQPSNILARTGNYDDIPRETDGSDVIVPKFIERAITLY